MCHHQEVILVEEVTDVHLNELEELFVVNLVALVHVYNDVRNANLTSEKDVLTCLRHRAVRSRNNEDSTVHLSSTSDHVLDVVSVARAVNVSIVTSCCLILNVCCVDRDTTSSLLRCAVDLGIILELSAANERKILCDSSCECGLTVVNVTNGADVYVRFATYKLFSCHFNSS